MFPGNNLLRWWIPNTILWERIFFSLCMHLNVDSFAENLNVNWPNKGMESIQFTIFLAISSSIAIRPDCVPKIWLFMFRFLYVGDCNQQNVYMSHHVIHMEIVPLVITKFRIYFWYYCTISVRYFSDSKHYYASKTWCNH